MIEESRRRTFKTEQVRADDPAGSHERDEKLVRAYAGCIVGR